MDTGLRRAAPARRSVRWLGVLGSVIAAVTALAASSVALGSLEWGGDSGPDVAVVSCVPAGLSVASIGVVSRLRRGPVRPRLGIGVGVGGLLLWTVALVAAFQSQSAYTSESHKPGVRVVWVILGALGALAATASTALFAARTRTHLLAWAVALVAMAWLPFGFARGVDNNVVLPIGSATSAATGDPPVEPLLTTGATRAHL